MENKSCPICEKRLIEQTWTAKSGKACHAFRHEDWKTAETECKDIETGKQQAGTEEGEKIDVHVVPFCIILSLSYYAVNTFLRVVLKLLP